MNDDREPAAAQPAEAATPAEAAAPAKMLSIWTWVALILGVYGLLLLGAGLYRLAAGAPATTAMAHLHADIWWPALMLVAAGLLFVAGRHAQKGE